MTEIISPDNQLVDDSGISTQRTQIWLDQVTDLQIITGTGTPEGIVSANVSRLYLQTDGTDGAVLYIKQLSDIGGDPKYGWVVCGGGSASIALEDLTDVTITSIATGELLKWNGSSWVNNTLSEAGVQPEEDQRLSTTDSVEFLSVTTGNVIATGNITVTGTVDGRDIAVDGIKLDGIEAGADVTDTDNVTAAGALMDSEVVNLDQVKNFDSADYATAAQGVTADNALPLSGGTMTGVIANFTSTGIDDNATSTQLTITDTEATFAADVTTTGAFQASGLSKALGGLEIFSAGVSATYTFTESSTSGYTTNFHMDNTGFTISGNSASRNIAFATNSIDRLTISGAGDATFAGDVTLTDGALSVTSTSNEAEIIASIQTSVWQTWKTSTNTIQGYDGFGTALGAPNSDDRVYRVQTGSHLFRNSSSTLLEIENGGNATFAGDVSIGGSGGTRPLYIVDGTATGQTQNASANIVLDDTAANLIEFLADDGESSIHGLYFSDSTAGRGRIVYTHSTDTMTFRAGGQDELTLTNAKATFAGSVDVSSTGNPVLRLTTTSATADPIMRYDTASGSSSDWATGIDVSANEFVVSTGTLVGSNKVLRLNGATQNATLAGDINFSGASPNVLLDADNDRLVVSGGDATSSGANIIFYGDNHFSNANKMIFRNSATTALTINASQKATFAGEIDASAGGIYLGGTAAANHLDDYEEGTWTPTNYSGGSIVNANYIKIGNLVTVSVYFVNGTFTTNNIGGLPFSPSTSNRYVAGLIGYTDTTNVTASYTNTSSTLRFVNKTTGVTPNNDRMMIQLSYFVGI